MLARIRRLKKLRGLARVALHVAAEADQVIDLPGDWAGIRSKAKALGIKTSGKGRTRKAVRDALKKAIRKAS